ncbi:glutathione S-transferase family protein [Poseidonocella sp. HB161398]|uniref:glutathione S-transferase family protein n=1 Tax=Poseidonocella sp. HB161398 TaxID=2320855 RepID=UPI001109F07E|nr:glutathione S-transferase family protein [Poseidonocella sp. HB161398]
MTLKLYCFGESGHSYKAALSLQLSGLAWEPVFVDFFKGETRGDAYRSEVNEMGEAPVLTDGGDLHLSQSGVIQQAVAELSGKLGGETRDEAREVLRWVLWDNHKLSSIAGIVRFQMNFLPAEKRVPEVIAFLQGRMTDALRILDKHLEGRDWIVGSGPTNADLTCAGYLYYPEEFGFERTAWPAIDAWLSRLSGLPGWKHPYELMTPAHPEVRKTYLKEAVTQ